MLPSNRPIEPEPLIDFRKIRGVLVYAFVLSATVGALFFYFTRGMKETGGLSLPTLYFILIPFVGLVAAWQTGRRESLFRNKSTFLCRLIAAASGYALSGAVGVWILHFPK